MNHVELVEGEWYHKCDMSGDPHVRTFDGIYIDLMQYNQGIDKHFHITLL